MGSYALHPQLGYGVLGHEKHEAAYVLRRKPALNVLGLPQLAPSHSGPQDLERWLQRTLRFLRGDRALLDSDAFLRCYRPVHIALEHGVLFAFVRRDASADLVSARAVNEPRPGKPALTPEQTWSRESEH